MAQAAAETAAQAPLAPWVQSIPVAKLALSPSGIHAKAGVSPSELAATPVAKTDPLTVSNMARYQQEATSQPWNVAFFGDSIGYEFSEGPGAAAWDAQIAPLGAVNYSVIGSTTYNLLFQLKYGGELADAPKVAVVEVGVDNLGNGLMVSQTVAGLQADIRTIHEMSPKTKVLVLGVFPSNEPSSWLRADEQAVNVQLARLDNGNTVRFANPGFAYVAPGGSITADTFDTIHPNAAGYAVVANVIAPVLQQMLGMTPAAPAARR